MQAISPMPIPARCLRLQASASSLQWACWSSPNPLGRVVSWTSETGGAPVRLPGRLMFHPKRRGDEPDEGSGQHPVLRLGQFHLPGEEQAGRQECARQREPGNDLSEAFHGCWRRASGCWMPEVRWGREPRIAAREFVGWRARRLRRRMGQAAVLRVRCRNLLRTTYSSEVMNQPGRLTKKICAVPAPHHP